MQTQNKDLDYYRKNAEEDYLTTPISVLRYISEMEAALRQPLVSSMYCGCQQSQCYLMNGSYICATCNKPIGK